MLACYHNPVRAVFGAGTFQSLPAWVADRKAALVTFPQARAIGLTQRIEALLGSQLACVVDHIQPNPDVAELAATYEHFWRSHADTEVIVAVGGGSTIDTAKAMMVADESGSFSKLLAGLAGETFKPTRGKALIVVPTTAGTGSEVTPWATIWDRQAGKKHSLHLPQTWPDQAVIDPELTLSLPASVTLEGGLDALSHSLESIWNVNANPVSDTFAVAAIHEIMDVLPELMQRLDDLKLRGRMAFAAYEAGMAFSNTKTALAHSISYPMTLQYGVPHGIACSFTLPMVLERAIGQRPDRDLVLAAALRTQTGASLREAPQRLTGFLRGLGVKTSFADYGVSESAAIEIVRGAEGGARGKNFIGAAVAESPT
jgi:phosphonate metabolism-associated iron-containing alcohol dehydrogenase